MTRRLFALSAAIVLVSGCTANSPTKSPEEHEPKPAAAQAKPAASPAATPTPPAAAAAASGKADAALTAGLDLYAAGKYDEAAKNLNRALALRLTKPQQVVAHKHLAFIHCAAGRKPACHTAFAKALKIDPALELAPAEAGHPTWGPVFKEAKKSAKRPPSPATAASKTPSK